MVKKQISAKKSVRLKNVYLYRSAVYVIDTGPFVVRLVKIGLV